MPTQAVVIIAPFAFSYDNANILNYDPDFENYLRVTVPGGVYAASSLNGTARNQLCFFVFVECNTAEIKSWFHSVSDSLSRELPVFGVL